MTKKQTKPADAALVDERREGRAQVWVPITASVTVTKTGEVASGRMKNLSTGGMYVKCDRIFPPGTECTVSTELPDEAGTHPLKLACRVVHNHAGGMGLQFTRIPAKALALLHRVVHRILYSMG